MDRSPRIHVFGASGSGTTTLGTALAQELDIAHVDTDEFYWKKTDPPFRKKNTPAHRVAKIREKVQDESGWILTGSICGWGDPFIDEFTLAVLLELDPVLRMERLLARENERYGNRIAKGGDMYKQHVEFVDWAKSYDTATEGVRCRTVHLEWMGSLGCPVIILDSSQTVQVLALEVVNAVA